VRCIPKGRNHNSFPDTYDALHIPSLSGPPLRGMPLCRAGRVRHAARPDRGRAWRDGLS